MKKVRVLIAPLLIIAGFLMLAPTVQAVADNAASKTDVTPGTQFTTFKGVPVFRLNVINNGADGDTITTLSPTPAGTAADTAITLHFFKDVNNNGIADQGDIDLGASAAFATNDTKKTFDITDVAVPAAGGTVSILITADGAGLADTNTFTLGFAAAADIAMTVTANGTFAMNNANALTVSSVAPAVTVANGATNPGAQTYVAASASNVVTKQLVISAAAGTSDSIVSLAPTPSGTENDNTNISSVVFYIDSGSVVGQVDGTDIQLVSTPATFSANDTKTTFTFSNPIQITQAAPSPTNILVVYNIGAGAVNGGTLIQSIAAAGDAVAGSGTAVTKTATASTTVNIDNAPTISSAAAYTDRIIINFSENVDGMAVMNCSNYTVGGASVTCGGMGLPFVDFQGNKATIRGLSLSGSTVLTIAGSVVNDTDGTPNALAAYNSGSLTVNALVLPAITALSATSGAVGDSITITGTNFGTGTGGDANHKVFFSGGFSSTTGPLPPVEVTSYTSWSATSIVVLVPTGANGGPVNVLVNGVMSDMNQNSFFDIAGNYTAKVWYDAAKTSAMPDNYAANIRIVVAGMRGQVVYSTDGSSGNTMTYNDGTDTFTITGVASMGWTWAYDITGAHLGATGKQVDTATTQDLVMLATSRKISGTITFGSSCAAAGRNKDVVLFAMPEQVDFGNADFKPMDMSIFRTGPDNSQADCQTTYSIAVPINGVYRIEAHIPPDPTSTTTGSSAFTDPDALTVTISDTALTPTGKNFTFPSATHRIVGTVVKPAGSFDSTERDMLWVFAYKPREGGGGTGTQVASNGTFTLYVTPGTWKIGVGGPNMPFPVEVQVDVDNTYELADPAKGPTIVIAPPSDFIEGYVKDSAGNGLANTSLYAWLEGGPGGGNAQTDSQGYYKMYVAPGSNYHIGANSQNFGFLGEQSNIAVTTSTHPTVNFTVSSTNYIISGTVTKGGAPLQQAFVFITEGENGAMLGGDGTDSVGVFSTRVSGGANRWIHIGLPGKGEVYTANLGTISADTALGTIAITASTIKVRISPASSFDQAFVGVHSDTGGGFADTPVVTADCTGSGASCREYQIDIRRPASGSTTYYVDGGIPGYGPLPQTSVAVSSGGTFTESSGTANDGIIEITLGGLWTISGTVTGENVLDAWVWASGPNGGNGAAVAADGSYSLQLRDGTYDIGVGKPGYIGNKITTVVDGAAVPAQDLVLTTATNTITGTVYLPGGVTKATNAWVWAEDGNGGWAGGSTDASGNYTLSVSSGNWTVKAAYDGYDSTGISVTAPASSKDITLVVISGFTPNTMNSPVTPSDGGIVSGAGFKVDFPKNALGTGTSAGTIEIKSTTNVVTKNDRKLVGTAKEITARDSSNQNVTTLSGSATIELTVSKAELISAALTFAQVQDIKITYFDSTAGSWVEIPTVVTLSVPTATTIAELNADPAVTLTGTTTHLSTYSPSLPTDADAPPTPTGLIANAGNGTAILSWTASAGAAKYDIYKKIGDDYPYLAQTTSVSYLASGLTNGTTYYFKVSALDSSDRESAATSAVSVIPAIGSTASGTLASSSSGSTSGNTVSASISSSSSSSTSAATPTTVIAPTSIPGCDNRTTGFSVTTGKSCVGNVVSSTTSATPATPAVPGVSSAIPATSATPISYSLGTKTLKNGSKGESVKELQKVLNKLMKLGLKVDGKLGPKTIAVIKKWQKAHGLKADGLVGAKTKAAMKAEAEKD